MSLTLLAAATKDICDRVIDLLRQRRATKRAFFEFQVQPLFERLLTIHADYCESISEIADLLENKRASATKIRNTLLIKRRSLGHIRQLVGDLSVALHNHVGTEDKAVARFAHAIHLYFTYPLGANQEPAPMRPRVTGYRGLLIRLDQWQAGELSRGGCAKYARHAEEALPYRWSLITQAYAELRIAAYGKT